MIQFFKKNKLKIITALIATILTVSFIVIKKIEDSTKQKPISSAPLVNTTLVYQADTSVVTEAIGHVEAYAAVNIKSLVDGQLLEIGFNQGDFVKKGQILFKIDPRPFEVALRQAKANLERDQAQLTAATALLEREQKLVKLGYVTKQEFDQTKADRDALVATIKADQANVANAELQLGYCTIAAPFDGKAGDRLVDQGNLIKANDTSSLVIINQITPIYVTFSIPEKYFAALQKEIQQGKVTVQIKIDNNDKIKEGQLDFVDNTIDSQTGMVNLKAIFSNADRFLWPGQFVKVTIPIINIKQALLIPTRAVQVGPKGNYVFVVKDNAAKIIPINLGENVNDKTIVLSGLKVNDVVITEGQIHLTDGMKVRLH